MTSSKKPEVLSATWMEATTFGIEWPPIQQDYGTGARPKTWDQNLNSEISHHGGGTKPHIHHVLRRTKSHSHAGRGGGKTGLARSHSQMPASKHSKSLGPPTDAELKKSLYRNAMVKSYLILTLIMLEVTI